MAGLTLDTGALVGLERGHDRVRSMLRLARDDGDEVAIPAGVVAQAWRGGARQGRLARLLKDRNVEVVSLDETVARMVGTLCGSTEHHDVIDVSVALCARERRHEVVTSDPQDIRSVDPELTLIEL